MQVKPIAKTDYTYCANSTCEIKDKCDRYAGNYVMQENMLYSFCNFNKENCIKKGNK